MRNTIENYLKLENTIAPEKRRNFNEWLLANGKTYDKVSKDYTDYRSIVENSEIKACFKNSLLAATLRKELKYVEGFYVTENAPFPFNHGFNVNEAGEVLDFTAKRFDIPVVEYFGVEIDRKYFTRFMRSKYNGITSLLYWYYNTVVKNELLTLKK